MDGKDIYKVGFLFGKALSKRYHRSHLFYDGFIDGWLIIGKNKSCKRKVEIKTVPDEWREAVGLKDCNLPTTYETN